MSWGSYSQYGCHGILAGPSEPPIQQLVAEFEAAYGKDLVEIQRQLLAEGVPINAQLGYYGYGTGGTGFLLEAWLIARRGYEQVPYTEVWEGTPDT